MQEISAGGIVFRKIDTHIDVLLIEDRYKKLTVPKGKQEEGETLAETALREIEEETGVTGDIVHPLSRVYYQYTHPARGLIDKEVMYYLVQARGGNLTPQLEEINKVWWESLDRAYEYQRQRGYDNNDIIFQQARRYFLHRTHD